MDSLQNTAIKESSKEITKKGKDSHDKDNKT